MLLHNPMMLTHCMSKVSFALQQKIFLHHISNVCSASSSLYALGTLREHSRSLRCCWLHLEQLLCLFCALQASCSCIVTQSCTQEHESSRLCYESHIGLSFTWVFICFVLCCFFFVVQGYRSKSSCCQEFVSRSGRLPVGWLH